mmetsp:Transcript_8964/g.29682  ORF Transcript_8964/g.29682 Transcript_8964/m.29682 type:complete len:284 (+) Transcript_8964:2765-3616(+)
MRPAAVSRRWCSAQSASAINARAACSCASPLQRSSNSSGETPPADTTAFASSWPAAAVAATAAAALALASRVPADRSLTSSSSDSLPLNSSLAGACGGFRLGAGGGAGGAGTTNPPSLHRASAAALRSAVSGSISLSSALLDSSSIIWSWPGRRGVKSTHTPDSFAFHQRKCATNLAPSGSFARSYTTKPLMMVQPRACCTRAALPNGSSGCSFTADAWRASSAAGTPVSLHRLPPSCFLPMNALSVALLLKQPGQPRGGEERLARGGGASPAEVITSVGSPQ